MLHFSSVRLPYFFPPFSKGQGIRVVMMRVGPGMVSQSQQTCPECSGTGETIKKEDACTDVRIQWHTRSHARTALCGAAFLPPSRLNG